jgi:hypothetical protein
LLEDNLRTIQVLAAITAAVLVTASAPAFAQKKGAEKKETEKKDDTPVVRYFASLNNIGDAVLKETRSGNKVTSATLDLCFPVVVDSPVKDHVVMDLSIAGQTFTGSGETTQRKTPVAIKLIRSATDGKFKFEGEVKVGDNDAEAILSEENEDVSEADYKASKEDDPTRLQPSPTAFTDVSPDTLRVKAKVENAGDVLKAARAENVTMWVTALLTECGELRSGETTIDLTVDPARAPAVLEKMRAIPGVVAAGFTSGIFSMQRAAHFAAADWLADGKIDRTKLGQSISASLEKSLSAKVASAVWSDTTGHLSIDLKRPSVLHPELALTETLSYDVLVAFDAPTSTTDLVLWLSYPEGKTTDDTAGGKIMINNPAGGEEGGISPSEGDAVTDLQTAFKAQHWDEETSKWVP